MAETESQKVTEDPNFKGGVMSPNSKKTFAEMRNFPPIGKHKLVMDEDTFEERFLRCNICKERYNTAEKIPKLLPCHHCFCLACVMNFYWKEENERRRLTPKEVTDLVYVVTVTCPTCGNSFVSTHEGLQELVTDHRTVQLLDFIGNTDKHSIEYCPKHPSLPLNFFCEACMCRICRDCIVIDHKQCSNSKMVLDIQHALQKYDPGLSNGLKEMEDEANSLMEKKDECLKAKAGYKRGDETIVNTIKETFDRLRTLLQEREEKLIEMAKESVGVKEYDFDKKMEVFNEKEAEVKEINELIKKGVNSTDIKQKYNAYARLKRYSTEPAIQSEEYENNQNDTVVFDGKDESILSTRISNFGEVITKSESVTNGYNRSSSFETTSSSSSTGRSGSSTSSSYVSSIGSYSSGSARASSYGSYLSGSSLYTGSSYSSRYTPRSYRY